MIDRPYNSADIINPLPVGDFGVLVASGKIPGYGSVQKFGEALDCDIGVATDVWDGADGSTGPDIWIPPTQARTHNLVSTSAADDTASGTGARTLTLYGLVDWDTAETSESITLTGTVPVATANEYVIIHRMVCETFGSGATNAGIITATAATDATVTAAIQAGEGQTLMLIYGVPTTQRINVTALSGKPTGTGGVEVVGRLLVNANADSTLGGFVTKGKYRFSNTALLKEVFDPPKSFLGPCIVKFQVTSDTNNSAVAASFGAYVVDL